MEPFKSAGAAGMLWQACKQQFPLTGPVLSCECIGEANPSRGAIQPVALPGAQFADSCPGQLVAKRRSGTRLIISYCYIKS